MSPADKLLPHLHGVRERGRGQWSARCPAHEDRSPSLSIKERDDGALLLHCWAGCEVDAIVGAVGLDLADLFAPRDRRPGSGKPTRRPWTAQALLDLAAFESLVAMLLVADVLDGRPDNRERLAEAARRLWEVAHAARA